MPLVDSLKMFADTGPQDRTMVKIKSKKNCSISRDGPKLNSIASQQTAEVFVVRNQTVL